MVMCIFLLMFFSVGQFVDKIGFGRAGEMGEAQNTGLGLRIHGFRKEFMKTVKCINKLLLKATCFSIT